MEDPEIVLAQRLADALNAVHEGGFHLMISDDEAGNLEYVLQEPGHFDGWHNKAAVAWDEDEQKRVVVRYA
jgi:hypothetical protein